MSVDFSRMKISELIDFAEAQATKERESHANPDHGASWAETLEILKLMKERGVPEPLADKD